MRVARPFCAEAGCCGYRQEKMTSVTSVLSSYFIFRPDLSYIQEQFLCLNVRERTNREHDEEREMGLDVEWGATALYKISRSWLMQGGNMMGCRVEVCQALVWYR